MIPTIGRIVHYRLAAGDVESINRRRVHAEAHMADHRAAANGVQVHAGNKVSEGDVYPLVITRVWSAQDGGAVNGQVLLDGNDTLWVSSVTEGDGPREWSVPPRV